MSLLKVIKVISSNSFKVTFIKLNIVIIGIIFLFNICIHNSIVHDHFSPLYKNTRAIYKYDQLKTNINNKVKSISVENWGTKYLPIRVWCCVVALENAKELLLIKETWGKYCDNLLFFSGDNTLHQIEKVDFKYDKNTTLENIIRLKLQYTGNNITGFDVWEKCWKMYKYLYTFHWNEFDWIIRADMDAWFSTYNFKGFVQYFNPNKPWWFGDVLTHDWRTSNIVYNAGGIFALSKETIRILNDKIFITDEFQNSVYINENVNKCQNRQSWSDDLDLGLCLKTIGIFPTNSLDKQYRHRFSSLPHYAVSTINMSDPIIIRDWWYFQDRFIVFRSNQYDLYTTHMISFHGYKYESIHERNSTFIFLDNFYTEKSKNNWLNHQLPSKPISFLFNSSFNEFDEYFNVKQIPDGQKVWKGIDNLWNYSSVILK
eukprot:336628_1